MSTRRLTRLQSQRSPGRAGKRRHTMGGKDVQMLSPFGIETPRRGDKSWLVHSNFKSASAYSFHV